MVELYLQKDSPVGESFCLTLYGVEYQAIR